MVRRLRPVAGLLSAALALTGLVAFAAPAQADPCDPVTGNAIACENTRPGTPSSEWDILGAGDDSIGGFTTDISYNAGQTATFKIKSEAQYTMDVYRMGYYGGAGARLITSVTPTWPQTQPSCLTDAATGLIDCGNWAASATWAIPSDAVSGIYFATIRRIDGQGENHVVFVVRNDASHSDMIFQTSDTTWQAYNSWGGNSLYEGQPAGRAYKVSYNRPFNTRSTPNGRDWVFANEYPMVRFLEANGYDVSYQSGIDTDRYGANLTNHKIFISTGHDEYWSGQQRTNVEAARDAGLNLAFFSGNEVYWKTRYEPSIDGANSAYRTMVTYKETRDDARTDPTGIWTGTWRDPRFSPPADGGRPENALTGTIFTVNCCSRSIKVPAEDGLMRFWRGTPVANQTAGQTATLPFNTLGYEWNEDLDNGFRPAGAVRLSSATYTDVEEVLQDYGKTVAQDTATHHLILYRAPSGALVFGAGTVQWSWGLDAEHDGPTTPTDPSMRQATVNLFADMGVQPKTLQSGLVAATKSTDTTAPTATITSPAAGATIGNGTTVTVTGTAADAGGGRVGAVEVSLDGGQTWHPASGRENWTYTGIANGVGPVQIMARASDDSANLQTTPTQRQVTVACPCTLFAGQTPTNASDADRGSIELGVRFTSAIDGFVTGVSFYKGVNNTGTHTGTLWSESGQELATGTFTNETATGWQRLQFATAVPITAGTRYVASYHAPNGGYAADADVFVAAGVTNAPLTAVRSTTETPNGVFKTGARDFPTFTFKGANYYVSPVFDTVEPPDTTPPAVTSATPVNGATSVPTTTAPRVTLTEPITAGTLTLRLSSTAGQVAGTTTLDTARKVATFTPAAALAADTVYTLTTTGGTDAAGNALPAYSTSFRTAVSSTPGDCPCSIWPDDAQPALVTVDDRAEVELGVRFRAETDGFVAGIRFYKGPQNTGAHTGTLWSETGQELATATFGTESATGWQEVRFSSRVPVTAGTTYVASYHTSGYYSATGGGLSSPVQRGPLTALAHLDGGNNGVYRYGTRGFPTNGAGTNYWVDVVFELPPDVTPPAVASTSPGAGATNVRVPAVPKATFGERVTGVTGSLSGPSGSIPVTLSTSEDGRTVTLTPATALASGTTYTATVGGAVDRAGNTMTAPYSWQFTTNGVDVCPCTLYPSDYVPAVVAANDNSPLELGVRFTPAVSGFVTGVRFYKGPGNGGTHVGSLWTNAGGLLTSATFTGETATGWQQVTFPAPVAVSAGATYVASYTAPSGRYSADNGQLAAAWQNGPLTAPADGAVGRNGVFGTPGQFPEGSFQSTGYAVDVVFTAASANDTIAPRLVSASPADGATSVNPTRPLVATFDEALDPVTVTATLTRTSDGASIPATVTAGVDRSVTVQPAAALTYDTAYTLRMIGSDLAGNALAAPVQVAFRTAVPATTGAPYSLWPDETNPVIESANDPAAIEVGVKFTASEAGYVSGVRFYKGSRNTGTHVGSLWSVAGDLLAEATFTGESAAGWQTVTFDAPVPVTPGVTYVASYLAPNGGYAATVNGLETAVTRGPLTAPAGVTGAPNGLFRYGGGFPTNGTATNYWVDVVFGTGALPPDTTAPTVTGFFPAADALGVTAAVAPTATFSEAISLASVVATVTPDGGAPVAATVTYTPAARRITITPGAPLASLTPYTVSVTARDLAGNPTAAATTWRFTTADTTPPSVTATTPAGGATGVATGFTPTATFSKAIDPATIVATLTPNGGSAVAVTTSYDAATRVVTISPTAALASTTTYTASVRAGDTAGNAMVAPTTWTFSTLDAVAPVITGVTATGSGTTATVTWTTNEASTSFVDYGTSASSLPLRASTTGSATTHTVTLPGLTPNTRYYFRVRSADAAGNEATAPATTSAPAQYAPTVTPFAATTRAEFTTGTNASTYVTPRGDGGVVLAPSAGAQEFDGTTLSTNWTSTSLATGSSVTVGSGVATVSGRLLRTTGAFASGRELDAVATLRATSNQWFGFASSNFGSTTQRWAAFKTTTGGQLQAETRTSSFGVTTTALPSVALGVPHRFEIDWNSTTTTYRVDGVVVATHARGGGAAMYIAARDQTVDANTVVVDSVMLTPFAASGTFTSSVIDASAVVDWRTLTAGGDLPTGTGATFQVRTGPNATAGGTGWSAWTTVANGADIPGTSRYLQWRVTFTTTQTRTATPFLDGITLAFAVP